MTPNFFMTESDSEEPDSDNNPLNVIGSKYVTEKDINKFFNFDDTEAVNVLHVNVRSMNKKFCHLESLLANILQPLSAIAVTETWLSESSKNIFFIPNYQFVSNSRSIKSGGGVGLFIHSSFSFSIRNDLNRMTEHIECVFVEINQHKKKNIIIGAIYRPPNGDHTTIGMFNMELHNILKTINNEKSKLVLLAGDYNLDLLKHDKHRPTSDFLNNLLSFSFYPTINYPTRISSNSSTLIDNIFVNCTPNHIESAILCNDLSDHLPVAVHIKSVKGSNTRSIDSNSKFRKYDQESITAFNDALRQNGIWDEVVKLSYILNDAEAAYACFSDIYSQMFNKHFPEKCRNPARKRLAPVLEWMTTGLLKSCNKRSKLYKKYIKSKSLEDRQKFVKYRNKLKSIILKAKADYYHDKIAQANGNIRLTWKLLNSVIKNSTHNSVIDSFTVNGIKVTDNQEIANKLNDYFVNVGQNLAQQIPSAQRQFTDYLKGDFPNSLTLYPIDALEVIRIADNLCNKHSCGFDNIPVNIMKASICNIAEPLSCIINCSMSTGIFPQDLKIAKVCPIYKGGEKDIFGNYRPISVLPSFSKIFEKAIANRLTDYLNSKIILSCNQYGFRRNHSTYMAIMDMYDKISGAIDKNEYAIGVFIDLAKAFDTLDHNILLKKLEHYGIRGIALSWFSNYLQNRKQYVLTNNTSSHVMQVTCGIPQGSILGPLMFILYINDLMHCSNILKFILFADDTNLFFSHKNINTLTTTMNTELAKLSDWFKANKLSLNVMKTNYIFFGNRKHKVDGIAPVIKIDSIAITEAQSVKFLGVIIDSGLSWKTHVDHIKANVSKGVGIMNKVRTYLSKKTLLLLYYTLIYPYLQYCNIVWGMAKDSVLGKLFIMQKRAVRICTNSICRAHSGPLFKQLGLLKLCDINVYQTALFMHKVKNKLLPDSCMHYVSVSTVARPYMTRNNSFFDKNRYRTDIRLNSIAIRGPKIWDDITPIQIHDCRSHGEFSKTLKASLIHKYEQ